MVDNLAYNLNKNTDLTPEDSDVSESIKPDYNTSTTGTSTSSWRSYKTGNSTYGNYYNWYAATAATGKSSMAYGDEASDSICPKGWKLPTSDSTSNKSFYHLMYGVYNFSISDGAKAAQSPTSIVASGDYGCYCTCLENQNVRGYFWSSSAYTSNSAGRLYLYGSNLRYELNSNASVKADCNAIRCVNG